MRKIIGAQPYCGTVCVLRDTTTPHRFPSTCTGWSRCAFSEGKGRVRPTRSNISPAMVVRKDSPRMCGNMM